MEIQTENSYHGGNMVTSHYVAAAWFNFLPELSALALLLRPQGRSVLSFVLLHAFLFA